MIVFHEPATSCLWQTQCLYLEVGANSWPLNPLPSPVHHPSQGLHAAIQILSSFLRQGMLRFWEPKLVCTELKELSPKSSVSEKTNQLTDRPYPSHKSCLSLFRERPTSRPSAIKVGMSAPNVNCKRHGRTWQPTGMVLRPARPRLLPLLKLVRLTHRGFW